MIPARILLVRTAFRRDVKRAQKRGKNVDRLHRVVEDLRSGRDLPQRYRPHPLGGEWRGFMECHIEPDWLLIYQITEHDLILVRTGTHSDLFD